MPSDAHVNLRRSISPVQGVPGSVATSKPVLNWYWVLSVAAVVPVANAGTERETGSIRLSITWLRFCTSLFRSFANSAS